MIDWMMKYYRSGCESCWLSQGNLEHIYIIGEREEMGVYDGGRWFDGCDRKRI